MNILVVDIGTSSVRAMLFDENANLIPDTSVQIQHQPEQHGCFDIATLQNRVEACIYEVLSLATGHSISAFGMDTFVGNIVGLDRAGQPLTPLLTYAETRARVELEALRSVYNASDTHQRTGCPHYTAYLPSQLAWFRNSHPDTFAQIATWVDLGSYLYRQWFGRDVPMSYSCASWTGLLHRADLTWDALWLAELGLSTENLAPLADFNEAQQGLSHEFATRWPTLADVPFYLAIGDGAAANIGSGATDESAIALTIGTTAALRIVTTAENPPVPDGLWSYRVDTKRHLIGGATTEGGNIYRWVSQTFQLPEDAEAQIENRAWGVHGLEFVPLLGGERTPAYNPDARGTLGGLRFSTTPVDILQAGLESVTHRLKLICDRLPKRPNAQLYAGGGALANSSIWPQMIADHFEMPIALLPHADVTARGVALLILEEKAPFGLSDAFKLDSEVVFPR